MHREGFYKNNNWLQLLSRRFHEAKNRKKLDEEIYYPDPFEEPEVWYKITVEKYDGTKHVMRLLNRPNERNDSYRIEYQGNEVYFNRMKNLVKNKTRWPLILGFSDAMRFMAKQFPRISGGNK